MTRRDEARMLPVAWSGFTVWADPTAFRRYGTPPMHVLALLQAMALRDDARALWPDLVLQQDPRTGALVLVRNPAALASLLGKSVNATSTALRMLERMGLVVTVGGVARVHAVRVDQDALASKDLAGITYELNPHRIYVLSPNDATPGDTATVACEESDEMPKH